MKSIDLGNMKIINTVSDTDYGFFWVDFECGKSLQCCLKQYGNEVDGFFFKNEIEVGNSGYSDGGSADCNEWAVGEDGEWSHIEVFLIERAREHCVQIVA